MQLFNSLLLGPRQLGVYTRIKYVVIGPTANFKAKTGSYNMTVIPGTAANLQQNVGKGKQPSLDLNPIKMLWQDLESKGHTESNAAVGASVN